MHVRDVAALPDHPRLRPRYRSSSFVAAPIRAGREVLGVLSVTDRRDNQPFTRADLATLRALAVPAALALSRDRALVQAASFAHAAAVDPLSGVFNRRHFFIRLEEELQRARRHQIPVALLMLDIDDFKRVNDSSGHLAGDTVIRDVAEILRRSVRVFDVCARLGGDEFAIIMPGSAEASSARIADRIRERIEEYRSSDAALRGAQMTVSVGLAVSAADMTARELIEHADQALYGAKRAGKNRVRAYDGPDRPASS
jgi:diguanylate cyclase (GGDEF)-like protein